MTRYRAIVRIYRNAPKDWQWDCDRCGRSRYSDAFDDIKKDAVLHYASHMNVGFARVAGGDLHAQRSRAVGGDL